MSLEPLSHYDMQRIIFIFCLLSFTVQLNGQRVLQIEKKNSTQSIKFKTTDIISLKLKNDKSWFSGVIYDFRFDQETIEFENRIIFLKDVEYIRRGKSGYGNNLMRGFSGSMVGFGASWALFSLGDAIATDRSFTETDAAISLGSAGLGYLMSKFFALRKYKIGKKWNFRMLNLDVIPVLEGAQPVP